jgi:hypothetical protein
MSVRNILKIIPIFLISTYTEAGFIESIKAKTLGNSVPFFLECVNNLKNQKIIEFKASKLCIDKYASILYKVTNINSKDTANKAGTITLKITNNSNSFVVKKIEYSGFADCLTEESNDKPACEKQWFDNVKYVNISPQASRTIKLYDQFEISEDIAKGEWAWHGKIDKAYGFSLDY